MPCLIVNRSTYEEITMKFFIDSANLDEIQSARDLGVLDGVTTNPSLIAKICEIVDGPVSAEVTCLETEEMIVEGEDLAAIHENVVIKCPLTINGLKAIRHFSEQGIRTNATLVFSPNQALLAAKAGASYVSPFIGRLDDISTDGMALVEQIVTIYDNYGYMTEVIVASVRHPQHVVDSAMLGADIATIPYSIIRQLVNHPLTDLGLKKFMEDAAVMKK